MLVRCGEEFENTFMEGQSKWYSVVIRKQKEMLSMFRFVR